MAAVALYAIWWENRARALLHPSRPPPCCLLTVQGRHGREKKKGQTVWRRLPIQVRANMNADDDVRADNDDGDGGGGDDVDGDDADGGAK